MKFCHIIVDNYNDNTQLTISIDNQDFEAIDRRWNTSDVLLRELNENGHFGGHDTWAKLSMDEWYFLLNRTIELFSTDRSEGTLKTLNFILIGIIKRLDLDAKQIVNFIRLQILPNHEFSINMTSSINLKAEIQDGEKDVGKQPVLHVVIDNGY